MRLYEMSFSEYEEKRFYVKMNLFSNGVAKVRGRVL